MEAVPKRRSHRLRRSCGRPADRHAGISRAVQQSELIGTALRNNRDVRLAEARIREYRALHGAAAGALLPCITANASASRNRVALGGSSPISSSAVRATGDLTWELDFWGRVRRADQAANFDLPGHEEDARATELTLMSDVATEYLQLRQLDESMRIAEATRSAGQAVLELARRRFGQRQISELHVRQFEAQVADPAALLAWLSSLCSAVNRRTHFRCCWAWRPERSRGMPPQGVVQAVTVPDSLRGELIARRPDVSRAQRDMQAALARIGVAVANRLPTITVAGEYGAQRPELNGIFSGQRNTYTLQAGLSFPIFTGGRLLNEERALAIAASIAERRYASGVSSYLEVLNAEQSLFNAQLTLVQVQQQHLVATVQLYRALGGSWSTPRP